MAESTGDTLEYEVSMKIRLFSTLDKQKLKNLLVIALWEETDLTLDGDTDDLEVIEYEQIVVKEIV